MDQAPDSSPSTNREAEAGPRQMPTVFVQLLQKAKTENYKVSLVNVASGPLYPLRVSDVTAEMVAFSETSREDSVGGPDRIIGHFYVQASEIRVILDETAKKEMNLYL